jgi:hypothetical protein
MGGTYCNNKLNDEKRCSITLCKDGIFFKSTQRRGGLYRFQEGNTDFSIDDGAAESGPLIDNWNLLDTVILHEVQCTDLCPSRLTFSDNSHNTQRRCATVSDVYVNPLA